MGRAKYIVNENEVTNDVIEVESPCCISPNSHSHRVPQYLAAATVTISGFSLGNVLGWSSPAIEDIKASEYFENLQSSHLSWIGSLVTIGALFGASCCGYSIEKIGRKKTLLVIGIPFVTGWAIIALAREIFLLYVGRFLTGFSIGAVSLAAPVYLSEISQSDIRGFLGAIFQVTVTLGILFTTIVGSITSWDVLAAACGIVPVIFTIFATFLPESPRYLIAIGRPDDALKALSWLRSSNPKNPSKDVLAEVEEIQTAISTANEFKFKYLDLTKPHILKPLLITLGLMFFNQFCGANAVGFNTVTIFKDAAALDAHLSSIIVGVVQVIATGLACAFVDKTGRRIILLISFATMCISLLTLGAFFHMKTVPHNEMYKTCLWVPLASVVLFNAAYCGGVGCLVWTVMCEILPNQVIGFASGLATTFNWTLGFITTRFFQDLNESLGIQNTFWLFAAACAAGMLYIYVLVPETKGKSLDSIQQENFRDGNSHSVKDIASVTSSTVDLV